MPPLLTVFSHIPNKNLCPRTLLAVIPAQIHRTDWILEQVFDDHVCGIKYIDQYAGSTVRCSQYIPVREVVAGSRRSCMHRQWSGSACLCWRGVLVLTLKNTADKDHNKQGNFHESFELEK